MYSVTECPICSNQTFHYFGHAKDYTVSHETFSLQRCSQCNFLVTSPRPLDSELGKYYVSESYVSHSDKATTGFGKLYEISRAFALKWKLTLVKKFLDPIATAPSILDYGCGTGLFLKTIKQSGFNIAGVEPSDKARTLAEKNTGTKIQASIDTLQGKYDSITLWHVLEHVSNLNDVLAELRNRLNKNGTLIIAVPNYKSNDAKKYGMAWAGYDVPRHLWHFEQKTMTQLLAKHNFRNIETIPMKLDAYYVSMLSEKYNAGNSSIITFLKGATTGFLSNLKAKQKNYSSIIYIARHA